MIDFSNQRHVEVVVAIHECDSETRKVDNVKVTSEHGKQHIKRHD